MTCVTRPMSSMDGSYWGLAFWSKPRIMRYVARGSIRCCTAESPPQPFMSKTREARVSVSKPPSIWRRTWGS